MYIGTTKCKFSFDLISRSKRLITHNVGFSAFYFFVFQISRRRGHILIYNSHKMLPRNVNLFCRYPHKNKPISAKLDPFKGKVIPISEHIEGGIWQLSFLYDICWKFYEKTKNTKIKSLGGWEPCPVLIHMLLHFCQLCHIILCAYIKVICTYI